jgi:hypothetical protein
MEGKGGITGDFSGHNRRGSCFVESNHEKQKNFYGNR